MAANNSTKIPFAQLALQYSNTALNILFPLILFPYLTRTLGPSGYGVIGFYESILFVVTVWASFGVGFFGLRLLSKTAIGDADLSNSVLHLLLINTLMAVTGVMAYLIYLWFKPVQIGNAWITGLYAYIMIIYIFHADWYFQSQERFKFLLLRTFLLRLFVLVSAFVFVKEPGHLNKYITISAVNYTLIAVFALFNIRHLFSHWKWDIALFKRLFKALLPFALMGALGALYFSIDTIMLARTGKVHNLGQYSVAAKIVRIGLNVFLSASIVFFVKLFRNTIDKNLQTESLKLMLHLSIPIGAMLFFFPGPVIRVVCGDGYLPSIDLLRIFSLLWIIVPLHDFFNIQVLLVHHKEKLLIGIYLGATLLSLLLTITGIHFWFTTGAAWAIVFTELGVLLASAYYARNHFPVNREMIREFVFCCAAFPVALLAALFAKISTGVDMYQLLIGCVSFMAGYSFLQLVIFRNEFWQKMLLLAKEKVFRRH